MDLKYIFDHVFLPPKLPQEDDSDFSKGLSLVRELEAALRSSQGYLPVHQHSDWLHCIKMISNMLETRDDDCGDLIPQALEKSLKSMLDGGKYPSQL
jgi:hypothetical protein